MNRRLLVALALLCTGLVVSCAAPVSILPAVPTTVPPSVPTAVPTSVPTAVPTAVPTSVPAAVPTDVPTPAALPPMIEPGDRIGDFLITKGEPGDVTFQWELDSTEGANASEYHADVDWGTKLNVSTGVYDESHSGKLDETWADFTFRLFIEERPVNLAAFGTIDTEHPVVGEMRAWNVVVVADKPGELEVHDLGQFAGKPLEESWTTFTFLPPVTADRVYQRPQTSEKAKLDYLLYLPEAYGKDPQEKWPLILYLHGLEAKGANLSSVAREVLPKRLKTEGDLPFIVVSPQGDGEYEFWSEDVMADSLMILLDEIQATYSIDPMRIYLTGADVGGNGTWEIGLRHPERFAALAPVTGYYDWNDPSAVPANICDLKDVPVWAFHGEDDTTIAVERQQVLVDALKACGGNAKFTVFPNYGNDIQIPTYGEPGLYDWLLAQSRR